MAVEVAVTARVAGVAVVAGVALVAGIALVAVAAVVAGLAVTGIGAVIAGGSSSGGGLTVVYGEPGALALVPETIISTRPPTSTFGCTLIRIRTDSCNVRCSGIRR